MSQRGFVLLQSASLGIVKLSETTFFYLQTFKSTDLKKYKTIKKECHPIWYSTVCILKWKIINKVWQSEHFYLNLFETHFCKALMRSVPKPQHPPIKLDPSLVQNFTYSTNSFDIQLDECSQPLFLCHLPRLGNTPIIPSHISAKILIELSVS